MNKALVTIGTTTFDSLIKVLDKPSENISIMFQIANGCYIPKNHPYERFIPKIHNNYNDYDFIITHAGAGSVYSLLETDHKFAVIPNTDRSDNHQIELAKFIGDNNYAKTYTILELESTSLEDVFEQLNNSIPTKYEKNKFFKGKEIVDYIQGTN